jgi:hypothetical protein
VSGLSSPAPRFCASCLAETDALAAEVVDGRKVLICVPCREEHPRRSQGYHASPRSQTALGRGVSYRGERKR